MKKFFLAVSLFFTFANFAAAAENLHDPESCDQKHVEVFVHDGCGFCAAEKKFLEKLQDDSICHVEFLDVFENSELFKKVTEKFKLSRVTPITIAGEEILVGFNLENEKRILQNLENSEKFQTFKTAANSNSVRVFQQKKVEIPFVGTVDLRNWALPSLAVVLGFVDGFNPCAMWVLIMFLVALLQMGNRAKMFVMAGTFIFAEAVMYAVILTAWLSTWNFVGFEKIVSPIVGAVAIGAGIFFLYEGFFTDGTCKVVGAEKKQKISAQISRLAKSPLNWGFFVGVLVLAFSVNIIEFACSIGIPQTFTEILHLSKIPVWEEIWLIFIYITFYMVDDVLVFTLALWSIEKIGVTQKYSRISNILGGSLMLILGGILLFAPQILG